MTRRELIETVLAGVTLGELVASSRESESAMFYI